MSIEEEKTEDKTYDVDFTDVELTEVGLDDSFGDELDPRKRPVHVQGPPSKKKSDDDRHNVREKVDDDADLEEDLGDNPIEPLPDHGERPWKKVLGGNLARPWTLPLSEFVTGVMSHDPCDKDLPVAPKCHVNGKCEKWFPRPQKDETEWSRDGYAGKFIFLNLQI